MKFPLPKPRPDWDEINRPALIAPDPEKSVPRNFLETADRMQNTILLGDPTRGAMSFQKSKIAILLLADIVAELPEERVGIMLPASAGATLVVMATLLNGKIPLMINWTLGDSNLEHVIKSSEVKTIITSSRFLDRLDNVNLDLIDPYLLILEDVAKEKITWPKKIRAALRARRSVNSLLKMYGSDRIGPEDPAVILYTSGSESTPKGGPLKPSQHFIQHRGQLHGCGIGNYRCIVRIPTPISLFRIYHNDNFTFGVRCENHLLSESVGKPSVGSWY